MNASRNGLRQSVSEYEATVCRLQSELSDMKEHHQEAREEVCGGEEKRESGKRERGSVVSEMYEQDVCELQCVCVDCRASVETGSLGRRPGGTTTAALHRGK